MVDGVAWKSGGLLDNIDKFANSLGYENSAIAIHLAMIPWATPEDRDSFITAITGSAPVGGDTFQYHTTDKAKG